MTLKDMIELAWQMQPFQLSGGPPWLDSIHYDIVAKPEAKASFDEMRPMLQALLADRFQLRTHQETKELPIYALVLARKDGKLGPDLTESKEGSCEKFDQSRPPPPPQPGAPLPRICGNLLIGPGQLTMFGHPISELTPLLSRMVERKVVDQTGLKGNFDISLQFPRDEAPPSPDGPPARIDIAGAIFSTFPDRLGLKFESTKRARGGHCYRFSRKAFRELIPCRPYAARLRRQPAVVSDGASLVRRPSTQNIT